MIILKGCLFIVINRNKHESLIGSALFIVEVEIYELTGQAAEVTS
jgi:hypothetical protein